MYGRTSLLTYPATRKEADDQIFVVVDPCLYPMRRNAGKRNTLNTKSASCIQTHG